MKIEPGSSTAFPFNRQYRMARIAKYLDGGDWLDLGCADGGYSAGLKENGAASVTGVEVEEDRVAEARAHHPDIPFVVNDGTSLPFEHETFDGVFMNEVLEHVNDERETLDEVHRVLRPGGRLIVISPNRWFPFEGHRIHIGSWSSRRPTPFIPWMPRRVTDPWVTARNYWPHEMRERIESRGFAPVESGFIMPVLEAYPWMPDALTERYRRHIATIDQWPVLRCFGVSNLFVGRKVG